MRGSPNESPHEKGCAELPTRRDKESTCQRDDSIASGFRQAATVLAELRSRGVVCAIFALRFDNEREKLRAQIEGLLREKALKQRRELIALQTRHARWLAGEFSRTGNWRHFKTLLAHVIAMRQRMRGDVA
jgi:hypothetical protein